MWDRNERSGSTTTASNPGPGGLSPGKQTRVGALEQAGPTPPQAPGKQSLTEMPAEISAQSQSLVGPEDYPGMVEIFAANPSAVVAPPEDGKGAKAKGKGAEHETGIATKLAMDRFVTAAHNVQAKWKSLDKNGRAQKLGDAANVELDAAGVPKVGIVIKDLGAPNGQFDFTPWNLDLNGPRFDAAETTTDLMAPIARTVYHESRHAEQWFRMARLEAGKGKKAAAIASGMAIKPEVAKAAEAKPLTGDGQEAKEGESWHKSVYGADMDARGTTLKNLRIHGKALAVARDKATAAQKAYAEAVAKKASAEDQKTALDAKSAAINAYHAAKTTFETTYAAYKALPEEADAWKLGDRVMAAYKST